MESESNRRNESNRIEIGIGIGIGIGREGKGRVEWNGMESNRIEWNGMEMEWNGNGMEWNGMNGMEWNGMEWNGMEWNGMESRVVISRRRGQKHYGCFGRMQAVHVPETVACQDESSSTEPLKADMVLATRSTYENCGTKQSSRRISRVK